MPNISTRVPAYIPNPKNDWEHGVNAYRGSVQTHMVHKCAVAENGCKQTPDSKCHRGFDSKPLQAKTTIDKKGFPVYRRDSEDDLKIVAHNPLMLMDWDGHCNVEWAAGPKSVLYLYYYLYKGTMINYDDGLILNSRCSYMYKLNMYTYRR
jgi:hypothetical protein